MKKIKEALYNFGFRKKHYLLIAAAIAYTLINLFQVYYNESGADNVMTDATSVHFIDVGQGDSSLIISGDEAMLIDAGGRSTSDELVQYIKKQGINKLTAVVATHPHEDHIGGMKAILDNFEVDKIYMPDITANTKTFSDMLDAIERNKVEVVVPNANDVIPFLSGAYFTVLHPNAKYANEIEDTNDHSIVLRLSAATESVLFMGDAEVASENKIMSSGLVVSSDVIKLGHHGSSTSSSNKFLKFVRPKTAIISCGKDNKYGHPHKEVIDRLENLGIEYESTAENGTIIKNFTNLSK